MTKEMFSSASGPGPKAVPARQSAQNQDEVQEASEESFPASDSPSWTAGHEAAPASSSTAEPQAKPDNGKDGCAVSFIMEERGELDKLCERTAAERSESYAEPDNVKESGGEG